MQAYCGIKDFSQGEHLIKDTAQSPHVTLLIVPAIIILLVHSLEQWNKKNLVHKIFANLVPRVLGLFGQRVSARRDSGIIDSIFLENVGSSHITYA